jgi:hypothetical protein
MATEHMQSEAARRNWRSVLNKVERGAKIGVGRYNDGITVWLVSDEWFRRAQVALGEAPEPAAERS